MGKSIQVTLTPTQYDYLIKLVYLGEWMINSHRDVPLDKFGAAVQAVYAHASEAGMEALVEREEGSEELFPTQQFDATMFPFIEEYDDDMFWEEFIDRMALRDVLKHYSTEQLVEMSNEERIRIKQPFVAMYEDVFDRVGLDALQVVDSPSMPIQIN